MRAAFLALALCATVHLNTALKLITEVMGEPMHDTTRHAALECAETHIRAARAALDVIYERQSNHLPDFKSRAAGEHQ